MPPKTASARTAHWLWPPLLLGCFTTIVAWLMVALATDRQSGWMALLTAAEVAFMLRLGSFAPGRARAVIGMLATALVIVAAQWTIASAQLGLSMGLDVLGASLRMGPRLAWMLSALANSGWDWLCYALALVLAAWASR